MNLFMKIYVIFYSMKNKHTYYTIMSTLLITQQAQQS